MASSFALSRRLLRTCGEQETEGPRSESDKQMDEYQELQKPAPRHMILRAAEQQRWVHGLQVRDGALRRGQECRSVRSGSGAVAQARIAKRWAADKATADKAWELRDQLDGGGGRRRAPHAGGRTIQERRRPPSTPASYRAVFVCWQVCKALGAAEPDAPLAGSLLALGSYDGTVRLWGLSALLAAERMRLGSAFPSAAVDGMLPPRAAAVAAPPCCAGEGPGEPAGLP